MSISMSGVGARDDLSSHAAVSRVTTKWVVFGFAVLLLHEGMHAQGAVRCPACALI